MVTKPDTPEKKLNLMLWIAGIAFGSFLPIAILQTISFGEVRAQTNNNTESIETIKKDYLPYFAFQNVMDMNQKMINLITTINQTTKDDPRYQQALKEWNELQNQILKQAGQNKRSSSYGDSSGN